MKRYIDIEKLKRFIEGIGLTPKKSADYNNGRDDVKMMVLDFIDTLQQEAEEEWKKRNDEMQKTSSEYRDSVIKHIVSKRVLPSFQGQLLHDFKNELNTMKQILNIQMWPQVQYAIFEKVALVFASWGGYHFHPKESLSKDELEQE